MMRDENGESNSPKPPGTRTGRTPDYIVEQRVNRVMFWMQQGHRTSAIYRLAAKEHGRELRDRAAAKKAKKSADEYPPLIWATFDTPVGTRTIDDYIARAKARFETEGRQLSKDAATQFGVIMSRLNDLYARAMSKQALNTCERLIRLHAELFAIAGSIRPTWLDPGDAPKDVDVPEVAHSEEQAEHELRGMIDVVMKRMGRDPKDIKWMPAQGTEQPKKDNGAKGN